jgi:hypothetical protein
MEEFRVIEKFPRYSVSSYGRIRNNKNNKFLVPILRARYLTVNFCLPGKIRYSKSIHRLVAEAFIPNPENKPQVNHKNGNKSNNHDWNLEWVTSSENQVHAIKTGLRRPNHNTGHAKTAIKVYDFLTGNLLALMPSVNEAVRVFSVKEYVIYYILKGTQKYTHGLTFKK